MGSRYDAGAMETNVVRVRFFALIRVRILTLSGRQTDYDDDGEPPFHSALETRVHRHGLVLGRRVVCPLAGPGLMGELEL